jgi:hypothetical protein
MVLGLLSLLAACAPAQQEAHKRFFWPVGVAEPKIEYLNWFVGDQDLRRGQHHWFEEVVLGLEQPKRIFSNPSAIASATDERVLVSDVDLRRVLVFDRRLGAMRKLQEPSGSGFREMSATVMGLAALTDGRVLASIVKPAEVVLFGRDERVQRRFGAEHLQRPVGLAVDETLGRVYVADAGAHAVVSFSLDGEYLATLGGRGSGDAQFNFPVDVAVDAAGRLFVLDSMNARIKVFTPDGKFVRAFGERGTAGGAFSIPKALAISPQGHIYVTDALANKVVIFDSEGRFLLTFGGRHVATAGVTPGGMCLPVGIDVDAAASIWVVDSMNRMFHQFQYLTPEYLAQHPILPGESYLPWVGSGTNETADPASVLPEPHE